MRQSGVSQSASVTASTKKSSPRPPARAAHHEYCYPMPPRSSPNVLSHHPANKGQTDDYQASAKPSQAAFALGHSILCELYVIFESSESVLPAPSAADILHTARRVCNKFCAENSKSSSHRNNAMSKMKQLKFRFSGMLKSALYNRPNWRRFFIVDNDDRNSRLW